MIKQKWYKSKGGWIGLTFLGVILLFLVLQSEYTHKQCSEGGIYWNENNSYKYLCEAKTFGISTNIYDYILKFYDPIARVWCNTCTSEFEGLVYIITKPLLLIIAFIIGYFIEKWFFRRKR